MRYAVSFCLCSFCGAMLQCYGTAANSAADASSSSSSSSCQNTLAKPPQGMVQDCQAKPIAPEATRHELCTALRPLLSARLVAAPRRKHSLLPSL